MIFSLAIALFASSLLRTHVARANPTPTTPGPGNSYNEGGTCQIGWNADSTGTWTNMEIQLMAGANLDMIPLGYVTTVDGTNANNNTYSYPCPDVSPNSAIYFYQFTDPSSNATLWTTRFAIADASGTTTPPANATQPGGAPTPWGNGVLISGLSATSPGGNSGSASAGNSAAAPPQPSSTPSSSAPASPPTSAPAAGGSATKVVTAVAGGSTNSATGVGAAASADSTSSASSLVVGGAAPVVAAIAAVLAML